METEKKPVAEEKKPVAEEKMEFPEKLYYSADGRYWVKVGKAKEMKRVRQVRVGLTRLGAEIYRIKKISIKPTGTSIAKGNSFAGFIGDRAGGLNLPISGTVIESNGNLAGNPSLILKDPYKSGWIVVIKPSNLEKELKQFQKVTSEEIKKVLEDSLTEEYGKGKEPYRGEAFKAPPPPPEPWE